MKKSRLLYLISTLSIFAIVFAAVVLSGLPSILKAQSSPGSEHNVYGFAWSENYGWISFRSSDVSSPYDYGVDLSTTTGALSGYAWSDGIGWISFNSNDGVSCGAPATVNMTTGALSGYAKATTAAGNGCVSLSGSQYGVTYDATTTQTFSGFAWNDVFGWISFNSNDDSNTGSYAVHGPGVTAVAAPAAPTCSTTGQTCTVANSCGTNSGTYYTSDSSGDCGCSASTPVCAPPPQVTCATAGQICYTSDSCGDTNSGTYYTSDSSGDCGCSASTPVCSVPPPTAPAVSLNASPASITSGGSSRLLWTSTGATSCSAPWTSSTATSGGQIVSPSSTTSYTLTCTGSGGSTSENTTVTVSLPPPTCSTAGTACTITNSCGSQSGQYYTNSAGSCSCNASTPVCAAPPPPAVPSVSMTATPHNISAGACTVNWTITKPDNDTTCTLYGVESGNSIPGYTQFSPDPKDGSASTTGTYSSTDEFEYRLTCGEGANMSLNATSTVAECNPVGGYQEHL